MATKSPLQQHTNARTWMVRAVIAAMVAGSGYLIFEFGRISAGYDLVDAASERQAFEDHITRLVEEIVALRQEVALLETHRTVDRGAYKEVEASLITLQAKIQEQQDAIAFYRGIVSPADGNAGLRVQDLKLIRGRDERKYHVRLVLVQAMKHDRKVSGDVKLSVAGRQNGVETILAFSQLIAENADAAWVYSFRYFQDFDRQLILPDGFTPESIKIEVRSRTRSISSIEESFAWASSQS